MSPFVFEKGGTPDGFLTLAYWRNTVNLIIVEKGGALGWISLL